MTAPFANVGAELVEQNLANDEESKAKDDATKRPSVLEGAEDK